MLLAYNELIEMIQREKLVTNLLSLDQVNGSSVDVRLGTRFLRESYLKCKTVQLAENEDLEFIEEKAYFDQDNPEGSGGIVLEPGEFILAATLEKFNLPNDISACFHMKSSIARRGLSHMMAGHCNPGWTNSTLTLELKNDTRYHPLVIRPGMLIGQMVFYKHEEVPEEMAYLNRGTYNHAAYVESAK
jgi:dCTP deaminase